MRCSRLSLPVLCSLAVIRLLPAQTASKVDFAKDVLPILRQNCVTCHSGTQPASGMRLDRKSAVINRRGIVPGSAENSFLFHRISGNDYGMQMPPTGALKPGADRPHQDVDRAGCRLAGRARQRSRVAADQSQGGRHGRRAAPATCRSS